MPFTLSHPAAVLPLLRHPFSAPALVCGAVAPDMPYFLGAARIPVSAQSWYAPFLNATATHRLDGLPLSLTFALLLLLLWVLVRRPLSVLLLPEPAGAQPAADPVRGARMRGRRAAWVLLSMVIGVLTHLVWDAVTHGGGPLVSDPGWLGAHLVGDLTVARFLQHLSTAGGGAAVVVHLWRRWSANRARGAAVVVPPRGTRAGVVGLLAVATAVGSALAVRPAEYYGLGDAEAAGSRRDAAEAVVADLVKGGGAALVCSGLLLAGGWWLLRGVRRGRPAAAPGAEDAEQSGSAARTTP